jgi:hypothetical protein
MTQHLEHMREGDTIFVRGPRGKLQYLGQGRFLLRDKDKDVQPTTMKVQRVNLIAGECMTVHCITICMIMS